MKPKQAQLRQPPYEQKTGGQDGKAHNKTDLWKLWNRRKDEWTPGEALVFTYSIVVFPVSLSSYLLAFQAGHELGEMMMAAL